MTDTHSTPPGNEYRDAKANAKAAKAYAKAQRPWFKKKRFIIPLALVALMGIGGIFGGDDDKTTTTPAAATETESSAPGVEEETTEEAEEEPVVVEEKKKAPKALAVTAKQILKEFEDNEAAADAKYEGKRIKVTGIVDKIDTEISATAATSCSGR
jgi:hypothetical protein